MLSYIYIGHYDLHEALELPAGSEAVRGKEHPVISHIRVHAIGKRYEVSGLAALALEKLRCSEYYMAAVDFVDVLRVAYQYSADETDDVRTELFAVALAKIEDLAASQAFLTQLAGFEELRDFAAQLLPHVFKFAADRLSKSEDQHAKLLAHKNETLQVLGTEVSIRDARAEIHVGKFNAMREKYDGELAKSERLEKLLTERSKQLEVAMAKIADLESAPSHNPVQSDARETEILGLQELLNAERVKAVRSQMQLDQFAVELQSIKLQFHDCEGMKETFKTQVFDMHQVASKFRRERDEAREKLRRDARDAVSVSDALKGVIDLVQRADQCRHCGEPQNWWMEWDGSDRAHPIGLTFRCGECTTRHW